MPQAFVFGSPIAHSLSPVLHRAAYAALGLSDWSYAACEVEQAGFLDVVTGLGPQVRGLSLTMPLKEVAFAIADPVSDRARLAGAINTLVRRGDGWAGDNTDIAGLVASLRPPGAPPELGPGMILGAGATARSALIALHTLGCTCVTVAARDPAKAHASLGELAKTLNLDLTVRPLTDWHASHRPDRLDTARGRRAGGNERAAGVRGGVGRDSTARCRLCRLADSARAGGCGAWRIRRQRPGHADPPGRRASRTHDGAPPRLAHLAGCRHAVTRGAQPAEGRRELAAPMRGFQACCVG